MKTSTKRGILGLVICMLFMMITCNVFAAETDKSVDVIEVATGESWTNLEALNIFDGDELAQGKQNETYDFKIVNNSSMKFS